MSDKIRLSIAIPTYNGAQTIRETFDSILPQLRGGMEILVSDNASSDDTAGIVREYQSKSAAIRYVRNDTNVGPDKNFDLAIRRAEGEFVWLFSDDDLLYPGAIDRVLEVLDTFPDVGAVFINYSVHSPAMECLKQRACNIRASKYCANGEEFLSTVTIAPIFCSSNIVRKSLWNSFDNSHFIGTNWVHYATLAAILNNRSAYCIADPLVKLISRAKWNTKGMLFKNTLLLAKIISGLHHYGYGEPAINKLMGAIAKPLPMTAAAAKRDGLVVTRELMAATAREFSSRYLLSTLATLLILLLPSFLFRWAGYIHKQMKWRKAGRRD